MEELMEQFRQSIQDEVFSKPERKSVRALVAEKTLDEHQLNFLRSKIYDLANEKITSINYKFILEWVKNANSALVTNQSSSSDAYFSPDHMHHKFMLVDGKALITGSYNWTRSAAKFNHENILFTRDGAVVKSFLKEFDQLWKVMERY